MVVEEGRLEGEVPAMGLAVGGNNEALIARIREATGADL